MCDCNIFYNGHNCYYTFTKAQTIERINDCILHWKNHMSHYVYIIHCINNTYYTGYTTNIERRYKEHREGSDKCRYTRSFPPKKLAAYWCFDTKSDALKEEARIKKMPREEKIKLLNQGATER